MSPIPVGGKLEPRIEIVRRVRKCSTDTGRQGSKANCRLRRGSSAPRDSSFSPLLHSFSSRYLPVRDTYDQWRLRVHLPVGASQQDKKALTHGGTEGTEVVISVCLRRGIYSQVSESLASHLLNGAPVRPRVYSEDMTQQRSLRAILVTTWLVGFVLCAQPVLIHAASATPAGTTRTYYVAADEVQWDYAPSGRDEAMGHPFDELQKGYTEPGPHRIGRIYKKAVYREYTDDTFTTLKKRDAEDQYLGMLGPILRAEVGDTIKVVFKNNATHPFSMHPHGVLYQKDSEGADYNDGTSGDDKSDGGVPPGSKHVYLWQVPERAGPGPADPSSVFWLYHSHADELQDIASGLFGMIVVTRRGMALPDGRPKDVDHEFVNMYIAINENESWYLEDNIREHTTDPKGVDQTQAP